MNKNVLRLKEMSIAKKKLIFFLSLASACVLLCNGSPLNAMTKLGTWLLALQTFGYDLGQNYTTKHCYRHFLHLS